VDNQPSSRGKQGKYVHRSAEGSYGLLKDLSSCGIVMGKENAPVCSLLPNETETTKGGLKKGHSARKKIGHEGGEVSHLIDHSLEGKGRKIATTYRMLLHPEPE